MYMFYPVQTMRETLFTRMCPGENKTNSVKCSRAYRLHSSGTICNGNKAITNESCCVSSSSSPSSKSSHSQHLPKASLYHKKRSTQLIKPPISRIVSNHVKVASNQCNTPKESVKKMDTCVPSPNLLNSPFATSPQSLSIYEQERPKVYCGNSKMHYNIDVCASVAEESGLLDDNIEDSSLKNVLTPELLSSISSSSMANFPKINMEESSSQDQATGASLFQLDTDSDLFFSNLLNIDSNDSKFSFPDFDCMTSNPPSSCHTPVPLSESKLDFIEPSSMDRSSFASRGREITPPSVPTTDSIGQEFVQKKFTTMKANNFPPRKSEPPVGVVTPVKILEGNALLVNEHPIKKEVKELEINNKSASCTMEAGETSPQTVPSFTVSVSNQKTGMSPVKLEPLSPEYSRKRELTTISSTEDKWEDVKHFMHGDSFAATKSKRRRCDSGSSGITSEDGDEEDNDYAYDSDDDNSDLDADLAHMKPGGYESLIASGKKQKQYFWQYNVQAKGPKGTRLKLAVETPSDPHVLNGFEDPVFDEGNTTVAGIRHGGKARKGDGNEVTPNPLKLFKIGHQLLRLNKKINACQLGSDVPLAKRNESRKEKNKLASRACRLKKKAQHEANKVKLHGLEMEHGQINNVLRLLWPELRERAKRLQNESHVDVKEDTENNLFNKLTGYISSNLKTMVAGHTTEYVNDVIMTVEKGDPSGGLNVRPRKT